MFAKRFIIIPAAALLALACSGSAAQDHKAAGGATSAGTESGGAAADSGAAPGGGAAAAPDESQSGAAGTPFDFPVGTTDQSPDDSQFEPQSLSVMALAGGTGGLVMIALTLVEGPDGPVVYAALKNEGDVPACDAGISVELYDKSQYSLAAAVGQAFSVHLYRTTDGTNTLASCVAPGETTMTVITDLPATIAIDDVGYVVYRCPYFALNVTPVEGFTVSEVKATSDGSVTSYAGLFVNGLDETVTSPSVTVFPVNKAGRPLGAVTVTGDSTQLATGGSWTFQTGTVNAVGAGYAAYPTATVAN